MQTLDAAKKTYEVRWVIGIDSEKDSENFVLSVRLDNNDDNDDDDDDIINWFNFLKLFIKLITVGEFIV